MNDEKTRTREQIFTDMFRELRTWNQEIPASPERMDPILRILMQMYAGQLEGINQRVDRLWDVATNSLVRSVCPDASRWPVPAHTVMKCELVDPVVKVDTHCRMVYKEQREGGQTFFFAPIRNEKLISGKVLGLILQSENNQITLPTYSQTGAARSQAAGEPVSAAGARHMYMLVEWSGQAEDLADATLFLRGRPEALQQIQWAHWLPMDATGAFKYESNFCPGNMDTIERMFSPDGRSPRFWGSFRSSGTIFDDLRDNFVLFPELFAQTLKPVDTSNPRLQELGLGLGAPPAGSKYYLFRLDLPPRGDRRALLDGVAADFGCFVATNRNELTLFKHTGGNRVVDIQLPEPVDTVLEIVRVVDARGQEYVPRYNVRNGGTENSYTVEERDGHLLLWFDFSNLMVQPPDSLTVTYAVTNGSSANGIEPGVIVNLYENHPGVNALQNINSAAGAIPAKSEEQILTEVSNRVRGRDRALTFADVAAWSRTFDPRIIDVECENGVQRTSSGVRRCIVVGIHVAERDFMSGEELQLLKQRLAAFLKARSSVNVQYQVEVIFR